VIGSQRHEARRIDNQLRGRAARQGDLGSSQFFLSLEDELMRLFGGSQVSALMQRLSIDDAVPIAHSIVDKTIEQSQTRVEGANFDTRKHLLEYDDVLNQQREVFYGQRNRVFTKDDLTEDVREMLEVEVDRRVRAGLNDPEGPWRLLAWLEETQPTLSLDSPEPYPSFMLRLLLDHLAPAQDAAALRSALLDLVRQSVETQRERLVHFAEELIARPVLKTSNPSRSRAKWTTWGTPVLTLWMKRVCFPTWIRSSMTRSRGSVRRSLTTSPQTSASMIPATVSKDILSPAIPRRRAKRAAQRPPFPHISTSEPSALKNRHRKSTLSDDSITMRPSAPTDTFRLQTLFTKATMSPTASDPSRLSIRMKSFPLPLIL
jgi:hypothetical protein